MFIAFPQFQALGWRSNYEHLSAARGTSWKRDFSANMAQSLPFGFKLEITEIP
jgi:hypothetical protein